MASFINPKRSPGVGVAFNSFNPDNQVQLRAPTVYDIATIGTLWVQPTDTSYNPVNAVWIATGNTAGQQTWTSIEAQGSAGVFSSLTVTPGPIGLSGLTNINTVGSAVTNIGVGGTGAVNIGNTTGNTAVTGSLSTTTTVTAGTGITVTAGNITASDGNLVLSTAATYISLPGPVFIRSGAGAPASGLALHVGDMYINTTAATAATRLYIATASSTWTNVTCAA
jgi:hypothetical protein